MTGNKNSYLCVALLSVLFCGVLLCQNFNGSYIQAGISSIINKKQAKTATSGNTAGPNGDGTSNLPENKVKKIALTFDDGPHPKYTIKLLDGLKSRNVKATFFIIGENGTNYPDIVTRISNEGHLIGNHTFSHVQLTCIPEGDAVEEINRTNAIIEECTGAKPQYIRPPYGLYSDALKRETSLTPVMWTIDPRDWSVLNTNSVVKHVVSRAKDGDIILLHDIFDTSVEAAFQIIDKLKEKGFEFVTIDEFY